MIKFENPEFCQKKFDTMIIFKSMEICERPVPYLRNSKP